MDWLPSKWLRLADCHRIYERVGKLETRPPFSTVENVDNEFPQKKKKAKDGRQAVDLTCVLNCLAEQSV